MNEEKIILTVILIISYTCLSVICWKEYRRARAACLREILQKLWKIEKDHANSFDYAPAFRLGFSQGASDCAHMVKEMIFKEDPNLVAIFPDRRNRRFNKQTQTHRRSLEPSDEK